MTSRSHGEMPSLRQGCFPQPDWKMPPHLHIYDRDALTIQHVRKGLIPADMPVFIGIEPKDNINLTLKPIPAENVAPAIYQIMTPNGWRCYGTLPVVSALLTLAGAGRDGVLLWMQGTDYDEAIAAADEIWERERAYRESLREKPSAPPLDLDLDNDISI